MSPIAIVGLEWLGSLALFLGFILLIRYLDHRERMAMIDRGLMPPERLRAAGRKGAAILRGGLITGSVGIAVTIGLYTLGYLLPAPFSAVPGRLGPWLLPGLIPLGVGAALVASHYLVPAPPANDEQATQSERAADDAASAAAGGRTAGARSTDAGSLDVGGALGRIIPWRLFARSGPLAASSEPASDSDQDGEQDGMRRHG